MVCELVLLFSPAKTEENSPSTLFKLPPFIIPKSASIVFPFPPLIIVWLLAVVLDSPPLIIEKLPLLTLNSPLKITLFVANKELLPLLGLIQWFSSNR